jgi:hypothetical protein
MVFFGIKGLSLLRSIIGMPPFLTGFVQLWPSFIQTSVTERLASTWLGVYYNFSSAFTKHDLSQRAALASIIVNITMHAAFIVIYSVCYFLLPSLAVKIIRAQEMLFMVYVIALMGFSVHKISGIIKEHLGPKFSRKIKLIGVFTILCFTASIVINAWALAIGKAGLLETLSTSGDWLIILIFAQHAIVTVALMLLISRAVVAQTNTGYKELSTVSTNDLSTTL